MHTGSVDSALPVWFDAQPLELRNKETTIEQIQLRIQDFLLGGADLRCGHFPAETYAKAKELGPLGVGGLDPPLKYIFSQIQCFGQNMSAILCGLRLLMCLSIGANGWDV